MTDAELDLDAQRAALERDRERFAAQASRLRADADDEEYRKPKPDEADQGTAAVERERLRSLAEQQATALVRTERALARLDDGTYGICASCGTAIPAARLEARPDAEHCVDCAQAAARRS